MVRREHNNGILSVQVETDKKQRTQQQYHRLEKSGSYLHYFQLILLLYNCASASNAVFLPLLWYQSHSFLAHDNGVVFSVSPFVSTRNFGTLLLCSLLIIIGATLVIK